MTYRVVLYLQVGSIVGYAAETLVCKCSVLCACRCPVAATLHLSGKQETRLPYCLHPGTSARKHLGWPSLLSCLSLGMRKGTLLCVRA